MTQLQKKPRYLALVLLEKVKKQGSYANLALDQTIKKNQLTSVESRFLTQLVYGVIQHEYTLDFYLQPFIKKPEKLENWVKILLRIALYQMVYLDKVPEHAIFNETAEISKAKGHIGIASLTTGILREIQRQKLPKLEEIQAINERLSITYSVPLWLVDKFILDLGLEKTKHLLGTINQAPNASIRVNTAKTTHEQLETTYPQLETSQIAKSALVSSKGGHFAKTADFEQGLYTIQDESSMLVAPSMQINPSDKILDACAAPGGKTTHIASYLNAEAGGEVTALDIHPHKVKLIQKNAERLGVDQVVKSQALDARKIDQLAYFEFFDKILVDAPCSGLGLMRRKPEIKYTKTLSDFKQLSKIQLAILEAVAPCLKVGGQLTYSTCTIIADENQSVIDAFLKQHPEFKRQAVHLEIPLTKNRATPDLQIYPDDYQTDGFFIANLIKVTQ